MAMSSNRRTSDPTVLTQSCCTSEIDCNHYSQSCSAANISSDHLEMQSSKARQKRTASDIGQGYHEANSGNQFGGAYETAAQSHPSCCQHSPWGCVRCSNLPLLNSPFQPTENTYSNQPHDSNSMNRTDMQLHSISGSSARISRQHDLSMFTSPGNQGNSAPQYASMRSLEQQISPFRPSVTPTISHLSTPQSIFSIAHTSPTTGLSPYDWGTPATVFSSHFKEHDISHASKTQDDLYLTSSRGVSKVPDEFEAQFVSDVGNDDQQWLQDAELDDLNYRRGSQSAAVQSQDQNQPFDSAEDINFMISAGPRPCGAEKQLQEYMRPEYNNTETFLTQQYSPPDSKAFHTVDLEFSNPFASNNVVNPYDTQATYGQVDTYGTFDFNAPFYRNVGYPLPPAVIPSNDIAVRSHGKQSRLGPSRSKHNGRDEDLDKKLVEWRDSGMSYKEIMVRGNFGLEESTLRGRYRTLTKSKEKRLRKPVWDEHAISALLEAVEHHAPAGSKGTCGKECLDKIPWKRVAEWMEKERKCYLYGNATVKKKYMEVIKARRLSRRQTTV